MVDSRLVAAGPVFGGRRRSAYLSGVVAQQMFGFGI